jgi:FAD/FMN-containing dehydrogenase
MIFDATLDATSFWQLADVPTLPGKARMSIEFAPPGWGTGVDRWGTVRNGLETMMSVKAAFDPHRILNRGRLFI